MEVITFDRVYEQLQRRATARLGSRLQVHEALGSYTTTMAVRTMKDQHLKAFTQHLFLGEIEFQSQLAAKAAERLPTCGEQFDSIEVWSAIQSILIAAGNVSKMLWPPRARSSSRGAALRALLDVDDNSPLSDRNFRNHFEHYDERIEDWMSSAPSAAYVDQMIGPAARCPQHFPRLVHRHYDPCTQLLLFRNESTSIGSTLRALELIRQKCRSIALL
jgi:hypothetical protein